MKKNLQELSNEELLKEAKKTKFGFGNFIGLGIVMIIISITQIIDNEIKPIAFLPLCFLPIAIMTWKSHKTIEKELKSRNLK